MMLNRLRLPEWMASLVLLGIGVISLAYPQTFNRPSLALFADNATAWTVMCLLVGSVRVIALIINGHWRGGTPAIRLLGCVIGAAMFGALAGNLLEASSDIMRFGLSWGVSTYTIFMGAEIISAINAANDAAKVRKYGG